MYIVGCAFGGHKLWGWAEWFGGYAVICGRRKIDGRRRGGGGRHICRPYGVTGTGDCRVACPQAAAGVYGCGDDFGLSIIYKAVTNRCLGGVKTPPYEAEGQRVVMGSVRAGHARPLRGWRWRKRCVFHIRHT